ncbi:hypothetical protein CYL31_17390 [Marinomonas sp. A3A]|nr:hypothetical protein CYL31_17390 [Marinomonas sp. A3A]
MCFLNKIRVLNQDLTTTENKEGMIFRLYYFINETINLLSFKENNCISFEEGLGDFHEKNNLLLKNFSDFIIVSNKIINDLFIFSLPTPSRYIYLSTLERYTETPEFLSTLEIIDNYHHSNIESKDPPF